MKTFKIALGVFMITLALWGGSWLCEHVSLTYQFAAFVTSIIVFFVGVAEVVVGLNMV